MKRFSSVTAAAVLLSAVYTQATELSERDLCASGSTDDNGNWYCQLVQAVTYTGIGHSGSYNQVTDMSSSGSCSSVAKQYSGSLAPFDEEVSLHFRGPLTLKQLAVYTPGGSSSKREENAAAHEHVARHVHGHAHEERALGDMVTATINGQVVSWANNYGGQATDAPAAAPGAWITATIDGKVVSWANNQASTPAAAAATTAAAKANVVNNLNVGGVGGAANAVSTAAAAVASSSSSSSGSSSYGSASGGAWARQGYYNSANGTSNGLVFLNHFGGSGSGVFDYTYGNSLSYASSNGLAGASSPQVLADTTLPSTAEVVVFTDQQCSGSDCGYVRPGSVAYHGFDGAEKVFLMEFGMPTTGEKAASIYTPVDMPAIWMLNAQIPRTLQYGPAPCSCWTSGCGEFDIFEVLAPGDTRCKSTIHGNAQGGDSDYFERPTSGTVKAAVVMSNNQFHIKMLDASTVFSPSLDSSFVSGIVSSTSTQNTLTSLFGIAK